MRQQHWKITFVLLLVGFVASGCLHRKTTPEARTQQQGATTVAPEDINSGQIPTDQTNGEKTETSPAGGQEKTTTQTTPPKDIPSEEEMKKLQNDMKRAIQGMDDADDVYDEVTSEVEEFYTL